MRSFCLVLLAITLVGCNQRTQPSGEASSGSEGVGRNGAAQDGADPNSADSNSATEGGGDSVTESRANAQAGAATEDDPAVQGVTCDGCGTQPGLSGVSGSGSAPSAQGAPPQPQVEPVLSVAVQAIPSPGTFDASLLERQLTLRLPAIARCIGRLPTPPRVGSLAELDATIDTNGVTGVTARTSFPGGERCTAEAVRRFRFHPGPTGGEAQFQITFTVDRYAPRP
ncbi:MAG: hypothetical protein AAF411_03955 [Myxococcota bacterium]